MVVRNRLPCLTCLQPTFRFVLSQLSIHPPHDFTVCDTCHCLPPSCCSPSSRRCPVLHHAQLLLKEMIFRGTDTTALVTEWVMAELVLNQEIQARLRNELYNSLGDKNNITDADVAKLTYLEAIVKETLRLHPIGPLLSWARLSTSDVQLSNGMVVPSNTTTMVNMWAITHDPNVWEDPLEFKPERFLKAQGGIDFDIRGVDLRLAPFGAGRRVCPGKNLGLATVTLWVAKLVHRFEWLQDMANPVDLTEVLKLSCEMKTPLKVVAIPRVG